MSITYLMVTHVIPSSGLASRISHHKSLGKRRHKVAEHVSAGNLRGAQESPVGAIQITLAQSVGFLLSPLTGLGTAEGAAFPGLPPWAMFFSRLRRCLW